MLITCVIPSYSVISDWVGIPSFLQYGALIVHFTIDSKFVNTGPHNGVANTSAETLQIDSYGPKILDTNFEDSKYADDDKYLITAS